MSRASLAALTAAAGLVLAAVTGAAELSVGPGASLDLGTGSLDLDKIYMCGAGIYPMGSVSGPASTCAAKSYCAGWRDRSLQG